MLIFVAKCCFSFTAFALPVIVRTICLFDNFEKLLKLLRFSRDMLEGWARVCCVHVFLVYFLKLSAKYGLRFSNVVIRKIYDPTN